MNEILEQAVRQRAYEIWMDSGRVDGQAGEHWIAAEHELRVRLRDAGLEAKAVIAKNKATKKPTVAKVAAAKAGAAGASAAKRPARSRAAKTEQASASA